MKRIQKLFLVIAGLATVFLLTITPIMDNTASAATCKRVGTTPIVNKGKCLEIYGPGKTCVPSDANGQCMTVMPCKDKRGIDEYLPTFFSWADECPAGSNNIIIIVLTLFNWLSVGVLIAVIIGLIIGGIMYSTAQGNAEQAKKGTKQMTSALLALGLYFIMWALLNFLVPGGVFNNQGEPIVDSQSKTQTELETGGSSGGGSGGGGGGRW